MGVQVAPQPPPLISNYEHHCDKTSLAGDPREGGRVAQRLIEVARPKKIILFGSYVRDEVTRDSDVYVLVVADDSVANTRKESVRLRDALGSIDMPMDILVVRERRFEELKDRWG